MTVTVMAAAVMVEPVTSVATVELGRQGAYAAAGGGEAE